MRAPETRFQRVLVANRGEIACRVLRTCRALGYPTVAIYSDADADAPHVSLADEAVRVGPAAAVDSYLSVDAILEAARRTGAEAIHPGYGFLAERAEFVDAVTGAGLVFIGPTADAVRAMGDKAAARALMAARGVPVVPGYSGTAQDDATLLGEAARVGFPLLVKASAGGGGKGMTVVDAPHALPAALAQARRLAAAAFGDDRLILERYVTSPRHIEVQIFGDESGRVVHLLERECSVQRRFQKIIEESPSPFVDESLRAQLCAAAVTAGEALGYVNAGTVEFIVGPARDFYFLEVNTRLQVEHPVTELITGLDLVALQLDVAQGRPLPALADLRPRGHAIECRLYAEDAAAGFLPATGTLVDWAPPAESHVRVDSGVERGSVVGIDYDPLLAKIITWGDDRPAALQRMRGALARLRCLGVTTNQAFLRAVLDHPEFAAGQTDTHFIPRNLAGWVSATDIDAQRRRLIAATVAGLRALPAAAAGLPGLRHGWRNNPLRDAEMEWRLAGGDAVAVRWRARRDGSWAVSLPEGPESTVRVRALDGSQVALEIDGHRWKGTVCAVEDVVHVHDLRGHARFTRAPRFPVAEAAEAAGGLTAPMPGRIVRVAVSVGEAIERGAEMLVIEAMKMEQTLAAPFAGVVAAVHCQVGDTVDAGAVLAEIRADEVPGEADGAPGGGEP